jgi:ABC-type sulfate transport system permease subunit
VASILTLLAFATLVAKKAIEWRRAEDVSPGSGYRRA